MQLALFEIDNGACVDAVATKPQRRAWRHVLPRLLMEAGDTCYLCNERIVDYVEIDHVIPLAMDGADEYHNLRPVHVWCNRAKGIDLTSGPDNAVFLSRAAMWREMILRGWHGRACVDCEASLIGKHPWRMRCEACNRALGRARALQRMRDNRESINARKREAREVVRLSRTCKACHASIAHRGRRAEYCEGCARLRLNKGKMEYYMATREMPLCVDCHAPFTRPQRGKKTRCEPCHARQSEDKRERFNARRRADTAQKRRARACVDCGIGIGDRGGRAIRCAPCVEDYKKTYMLAWRARQKGE